MPIPGTLPELADLTELSDLPELADLTELTDLCGQRRLSRTRVRLSSILSRSSSLNAAKLFER